jgi:ribosomal protein L37E
MRWRQSFLAEVSQSLRRLGLTACPVCGLADSLGVGHLPVLLNDGGFPLNDGGFPSRPHDCSLAEDRCGDLTFAVRVECAACGYLMLFNALRFRTADEKIIVPEGPDEECQLGE